MVIQSLRLVSFRAHAESRLSLAPGINLFYGENGAGKTNLLEAVHYLCLSKSFLASTDTYALRKGCSFFEIEGTFAGTHRRALRVRLAYAAAEGKRLFVNGAPLERLSEIVGQVPVVVASPGDFALTSEGPDVRRRFIDNILSQSRPVYLDDLINYRRALRQRNVLLAGHRRSTMPAGLLSSWDAELVKLGSRVVQGRLRFVNAFSGYLEDAYRHMEGVGEHPTMQYETIGPLHADTGEEAVARTFEERLARAHQRERELGRTLVGPQYDELVFRLNNLEVRRYASQGQHRTFGMALKLAQFAYLKAQLDEAPILLLDDLFGSLDPRRTAIVLDLLQSDAVGQSLLTATSRSAFDAHLSFTSEPNRAFLVQEGRVEAASTGA